MKSISKFLALFLFAISAFSLLSCSDDDNGGYASGEFFEITINGNTKTTALESTTVSRSSQYCFIQSGETYPVDFMLTYYSDLERVGNASTGNYRFCPDGNPQNLDLDISYELNGSYLFCEKGVHTVTLIKKIGDEVLIEGNFSGTFILLGNYGSTIAGRLPFSGKYRILLYRP